MSEPVETLEGSYVLHDFRTIDWDIWRRWSGAQREQAVAALERVVRGWEEATEDARAGSTGLYSIVGNRADVLLLNMRPTLEELFLPKRDLNLSDAGPLLKPAYGYVSMVELSAYLAKGNPDPDTNPYLKERLFPRLPNTRAVCFYPMSKRRQGTDNWYMMERHDRAQLMRGHGAIGHKYHDRVIQIISGSQGLDDWEWGVTLFADDPLDFKKLVYEMRFDEASARFADFGPFFVGHRTDVRGLASLLRE